jgi:hypothetical protein
MGEDTTEKLLTIISVLEGLQHVTKPNMMNLAGRQTSLGLLWMKLVHLEKVQVSARL